MTKVPSHLNGRCTAEGQPVTNLILASLPDVEYEILKPSLGFVSMEWHTTLHRPGEKIDFGYFPNDGVISFVVPVSDGRSAEVGLVGKEGFVGTPLAGGLDRSPHLALVQVEGTASRVPARELQKILASTPHLATLLTRHALVHGMQLAQTAACNRLHDLEQRLARWLLMSQDRIGASTLPYTQELLGIMLGTDRPSVCIAIGKLQKKGSIRQSRGKVEILDRNKLKKSACECYAVILEFNKELNPDRP